MEQNTVNTMYDKLDELREAFDAYVDKSAVSETGAAYLIAILDGMIRALREAEETGTTSGAAISITALLNGTSDILEGVSRALQSAVQ